MYVKFGGNVSLFTVNQMVKLIQVGNTDDLNLKIGMRKQSLHNCMKYLECQQLGKSSTTCNSV